MPFLMSSVDPNKISLTIKGLTVFVPTIVVFLSYFNVNVGNDELNTLIDMLADFVLMAAGVISFGITLYGYGRRLFAKSRS